MPICPKCRGENPELGAKCPRDGYYYIYEDALDAANKDEWIGKLAADKYVILSLISEGGMGAVYQAMQLPVQREVAFKVLRAELQDSDQGHDRFAREARAVSKLSHPNIITMHDFGVDSGGHPFMVMEYAPGKSLADWIVQPGLRLGRITHVFRQILSALSEAHNQGVVHRDLKPENLIVTRTGADDDYIKLLDFGIARMVHDGATRGLTKEGEVFGTPHYMAPEQAQGKKEIGPPADVYALGIMLYELLVGECPFDAPTPLSILYMHINDDLPELRPRNGIDVSPELREVIERATAKDASQRYADASEMLAAFDEATGNTTGKYVGPASTSSESITATQNMGAQPYLKKATADTLRFGDEAAARQTDEQQTNQHETSSTNAVPVHDPEQPQQDEPRNNTTFEMEAFGTSGATKALMVAAALVVLVGLGGAALFFGEDSSAVEANEQQRARSDDEAAPDESEELDEAGSEPSDQAAEMVASEDEPAVEKPIDEETLDEEPLAADEGEPTAADTEHQGAQVDDSRSVDAPSASDSQPAKTQRAAARDSAAEQVEPPAPAPSPSKPTGVAEEASSAPAGAAKTETPEKFQPKKFEPKKASDDEPKKFEPKKWR